MIPLLVAATAFDPVMTVAEVTTSKGKKYRVETCFRDPRHLHTQFIYPDRRGRFDIDGDSATTTENQDAPRPASDSEKAFAFGHQFHAIHVNFAKLDPNRRKASAIPGANALRPGWTGAMPYGGTVTSLRSAKGRVEGYWFDVPDTTPIMLRFSDWRDGGRIPYRLQLNHAGTVYDYRFTKIEFRC